MEVTEPGSSTETIGLAACEASVFIISFTFTTIKQWPRTTETEVPNLNKVKPRPVAAKLLPSLPHAVLCGMELNHNTFRPWQGDAFKLYLYFTLRG